MRADPAIERISIRVAARLKRALAYLFETDAKEYRSLSEFVAATLEEIARKQAPHFFVATGDDEPRVAPAQGPEPTGRPPRRVLRFSGLLKLAGLRTTAGRPEGRRLGAPGLPGQPAAQRQARSPFSSWNLLSTYRWVIATEGF